MYLPYDILQKDQCWAAHAHLFPLQLVFTTACIVCFMSEVQFPLPVTAMGVGPVFEGSEALLRAWK